MSLYRRLRRRERDGEVAAIAITGAGFMARGLVRQLELTPGMRPALIINRTAEAAVACFAAAGHPPAGVVVSDDGAVLRDAIAAGRPAVATSLEVLADAQGLDVLVEVTGAVEHGADAALTAIDAGLHVVMLNAETDATVGSALRARADEAGVVYTVADGDQPAVLMRLVEYVEGMGFEVVAAINCKGFLDVHATPETIAPWAERQQTSLPMTTAFTDGTKMNIEAAVLSNASGLVPEVRGMRGVKTMLRSALDDCAAAFGSSGLVDYTLGGDFGGGVFVIGRSDDRVMVHPYMKYLKMGGGPDYLFFRPWHLCHLETPLSIAEVLLEAEPTMAPLDQRRAEVVCVAKRDLRAGERLDGIGGYTCYGQIDTIERADGLLPVGLCENVLLTRDVRRDEVIPIKAVEAEEDALLWRLWREQQAAGARKGRRMAL